MAGGGEGDAAGGAGEQGVADLGLQAADLLAQGRLGDAEAGRGVAEVEFLGEDGEGVELGEGEFGALGLLGCHISIGITGPFAAYWTYRCGLPSVPGMTERQVVRRAVLSGSVFEEEIGYARAVVDGDWVHVSGTTGFDYAAMTISEDVVEQAEQCLRNVGAALEEAGSSFAEVVRVRYLLPERADFEPCWPVLRRYFGQVRPAATMMVCGLADPRMKIEIEVYARRGNGTCV
ncbi:Putative aminoacrylate peracid reductase RutC [Streptomyces chartreusis]